MDMAWFLSGRSARVDHETLAGRPLRLVRGQVDGDRTDIGGLAEAAQRICFSPAARTCSSCMYGAVRSVSIQPGQIALTRTLWRAHSIARLFVRLQQAALGAEQ